MLFKSIQTKYIILVSVCVVASALLIGFVCVHTATQMSAREAAQNMNLTCESYMNKYDISLQNTQDAVETTAAFASDALESIERFEADEDYRNAYAERLEDALLLETRDAPIVASCYVRFSPDLLSYDMGFRYAREGRSGQLHRTDTVRIKDFQEGDSEHVGWYYKPIDEGKTVWLEPYYNANSDSQMVSCVAPFYKNGVLVGIVGIDINFSQLITDLKQLRILDNGYAFLCSSEGKIYYHPLYEGDTYIQQDVQGFDAQLSDESSGDILYSGISKGEDIEYAFRTLTNGMRLVLRAPLSEINADADAMINTIALLTLAVVVVSILVTVVVSRRITKPLKRLTEAARQISRGDYDISLDIASADEVGVLAHTLQDAATELKASSEYMQQLAYRDPLTSVRNKTAYDLEVASLEKAMADGTAKFAVAVFDVNDLKTANDLYGHEQGDKVIRTGCSRICRTFEESPVFRVGGDEFVAILQGHELEHADTLLTTFAKRGEAENSIVEKPQDAVRVAAGIAVYDPATDKSVQDVFNRADAKMYEEKVKMKGGRAVR